MPSSNLKSEIPKFQIPTRLINPSLQRGVDASANKPNGFNRLLGPLLSAIAKRPGVRALLHRLPAAPKCSSSVEALKRIHANNVRIRRESFPMEHVRNLFALVNRCETQTVPLTRKDYVDHHGVARIVSVLMVESLCFQATVLGFAER